MKKKTAVIFLTGLMIFTMSGYFVNVADTSAKEENENSNILIAYFTVPEDIDTNGIDADSGASVVVKDEEALGNMEYMALTIQDAIGGDLFRIETKEAYPLDHEPLVDQAAEEQDENARPELATHIENPEQYDTILLGYPNWWGDMPQPLFLKNMILIDDMLEHIPMSQVFGGSIVKK